MTIRKGSGIRGAMIALVMVAALGSGPKALGAPVPGQNDDDAIVEINSEAELECLKSALKEREALGQERADELWIRCGGKAVPPVADRPSRKAETNQQKPPHEPPRKPIYSIYVSPNCAKQLFLSLPAKIVMPFLFSLPKCASIVGAKK